MPILSEAGSDRSDIIRNASRYALEFDEFGAQAISAVPAKYRNIKMNLVQEAFFHPGDPYYDIRDPKYGKATRQLLPTVERVLNILKLPDTREVFGLTFRDLIEMDDLTLTYIYDTVYDLYKERLDLQKEQEKSFNGK